MFETIEALEYVCRRLNLEVGDAVTETWWSKISYYTPWSKTQHK